MIVLGIVLTIIGFLLLLAFLLSRSRCRTETEAEIVRIIEKKQYVRGRTVRDCRPVFKYCVNGKEYTVKSDHSTSDPKKYAVGQKMTVYTDAARKTYGTGATPATVSRGSYSLPRGSSSSSCASSDNAKIRFHGKRIFRIQAKGERQSRTISKEKLPSLHVSSVSRMT